MKNILISSLVTGCLCLSAGDYQVKQKEIPYVVTSRGSSKALASRALMTPGEWLPFSFIVSDGSFVKKGDVVATFDSTDAEFEYKSMLFEKEVVEQRLKYELTEIENDRLGKNDRLEAVIDDLKIQKASLEYLKDLPLEDEVQKAEGKLRISLLEYDAAMKEFVKAQARYKKEFISKTELEQTEQDLKVKKASLEYSKAFLAYQKLPAKKSDLTIQRLRVSMAQLEVDELKYEMSQLAPLQEFEKKTAKDKKRIIDRKLKQKKQDLDNTVLKAPVSGYVKHFESGRKLGPGAKYWSEFRFADIPDITSIVFESQLPEESRKFYKLNDPVLIYATGRKGNPVKGYISQIAGVPIDLGEKEARTYGATVKLTGIKVYQIQVKPEKYEDWMKPGMTADINVTSSSSLKYPAVPVKYLMVKDGKNYLSVNGIYQQVGGFINQGWFMIEDPEFKALTVDLDGEFQEDKDEKKKSGGRFMASAEVLPVESTQVIVPDIYGEGKIYWLKEEESEVKKGDVLIKMSGVDTEKVIAVEETKKAVLLNTVNTQTKKLSISKKENEFKLKTEKALLEIRKIQRDVLLNEVDERMEMSSKLSLLQAQISYENAVSELKRIQGKNPDFVSKADVEKAIRNEKRRKLGLEQAQINFDEVKRGATEVKRSKAELDFHTQKVNYENNLQELKYEEAADMKDLKESELKLQEVEIELAKRVKQRDRLEIKAPADGIIRYGKVWDNGLIDKITVGTGLRDRMIAMTIPNLSSFYIQVEVPEKYFKRISQGQKVEIRIPAVSEETYAGKVLSVEYLFKTLARQDTQIGMYSSQEPLGETVFKVNISIDLKGRKIKPGVIADVYFPFRRY